MFDNFSFYRWINKGLIREIFCPTFGKKQSWDKNPSILKWSNVPKVPQLVYCKTSLFSCRNFTFIPSFLLLFLSSFISYFLKHLPNTWHTWKNTEMHRIQFMQTRDSHPLEETGIYQMNSSQELEVGSINQNERTMEYFSERLIFTLGLVE